MSTKILHAPNILLYSAQQTLQIQLWFCFFDCNLFSFQSKSNLLSHHKLDIKLKNVQFMLYINDFLIEV